MGIFGLVNFAADPLADLVIVTIGWIFDVGEMCTAEKALLSVKHFQSTGTAKSYFSAVT